MADKMKHLPVILLFLLLSIGSVLAQDQNASSAHALYSFLDGSYRLIGKYPDSDETYSGKVVLAYAKKGLSVSRLIDNRKIQGKGTLEAATGDAVQVLRVRFLQDGQTYEATYLINSDLDNYARLSGYYYRQDGTTKDPGLEAWFIDHQAAGQ